jgi:hypothetical protein
MSETPNHRRHSTCLTATAILLVLLGAYVGGYFLLGDYQTVVVNSDQYVFRSYRYAIVRRAYWPCG